MKGIFEASLAIAHGVRLSRPQVIPMYPITPQTHIVERLADMINDGDLDAEMIHVESEHSACSALIGSVAAGSRSFTATASQGLAYMYEILPIISGLRLPAVMAVANRSLSAPLNIWNDHADAVSARDQGWIQLWAESSQEALDSVIQAVKISEDRGVLLPVMVNLDGFTLSHVWEPVDIPEQKEVDKFLPKFKFDFVLDPNKPVSIGNVATPDTFMEFRELQEKAMQDSRVVVKKVNDDYKKAFGRGYGDGLLELYEMKDAEFAVIGMGTLCGTARVAVDNLRKKGIKAGLIKLRCLRPFPEEELVKVTKNLKGLGVLDRHISLGFEGPLYTDIKSSLYGKNDLQVNSYIAGLGGRDIKVGHIEKALTDLTKGSGGGWLK